MDNWLLLNYSMATAMQAVFEELQTFRNCCSKMQESRAIPRKLRHVTIIIEVCG